MRFRKKCQNRKIYQVGSGMVPEDEPVTPSELGDRFAGVRIFFFVKKIIIR